MKKEIEKYVCLYLLVYVAILAICGFFQYMAICQGKSLACAFDMEGMNKIITTIASVITPIVAIVGFINWRDQELYKKSIDIIQQTHEKSYELLKQWIDLRNEKYCDFIMDYSADIIKSEIQDESKYLELDHKITEIFNTYDEIILLTNTLYFNKSFDNIELDNVLIEISDYLEQYKKSFLNYRMNIRHKSLRGNFFHEDEIVRDQLFFLSSLANNYMIQLRDINHDDAFRILHKNLIIELKKIKNNY